MQTVDKLPDEWRRLVNEYGYIETYKAWKRGMSPAEFLFHVKHPGRQ